MKTETLPLPERLCQQTKQGHHICQSPLISAFMSPGNHAPTARYNSCLATTLKRFPFERPSRITHYNTTGPIDVHCSMLSTPGRCWTSETPPHDCGLLRSFQQQILGVFTWHLDRFLAAPVPSDVLTNFQRPLLCTPPQGEDFFETKKLCMTSDKFKFAKPSNHRQLSLMTDRQTIAIRKRFLMFWLPMTVHYRILTETSGHGSVHTEASCT